MKARHGIEQAASEAEAMEKPEGEGWRHPLSTFYGISGIPTVILIGRDGNVITLNARGKKLGDRLAELFKDGG